jgi:hypothetical protein
VHDGESGRAHRPAEQSAEATLVFDPNLQEPCTKQTQLWASSTPICRRRIEPTGGSKIHKLRGDIEADKAERSVTRRGSVFVLHGESPERGSGARQASSRRISAAGVACRRAGAHGEPPTNLPIIMREAPAAVASRYRMDFRRATFRAIRPC